jgi:hypothetical protein
MASGCPMLPPAIKGRQTSMARRDHESNELSEDVMDVVNHHEKTASKSEPHGDAPYWLDPVDPGHDGSLFGLQLIIRILQDDLVILVAG